MVYDGLLIYRSTVNLAATSAMRHHLSLQGGDSSFPVAACLGPTGCIACGKLDESMGCYSRNALGGDFPVVTSLVFSCVSLAGRQIEATWDAPNRLGQPQSPPFWSCGMLSRIHHVKLRKVINQKHQASSSATSAHPENIVLQPVSLVFL